MSPRPSSPLEFSGCHFIFANSSADGEGDDGDEEDEAHDGTNDSGGRVVE